MPYDERLAARVRKILSARRDVGEKRMVGGLSFLVGGKMCCGIAGDGLMVRVGAEARDKALTEPHVRPMQFAGRRLKGFIRVGPAGCRTDAALARWVKRGVDFAAALPERK
jgi:TfoX/Sxy family transcriptional regulator of competence genes